MAIQKERVKCIELRARPASLVSRFQSLSRAFDADILAFNPSCSWHASEHRTKRRAAKMDAYCYLRSAKSC